MSRLTDAVALPRVLRKFAAILLFVGAAGCVTEGNVFEPPGGAGGGEQVPVLATLFAKDPLRQRLDFETGGYGTVIQDGEARNANSHLDFGFYMADGFTVGVQGGDQGTLVDLGDEAELSRANGGASVFASLSLDGQKLSIPAADVVFDPAQPNQAPVVLGHLYVARIVHDEGEIIVKLIAIDHTPERLVTIDWVRLR